MHKTPSPFKYKRRDPFPKHAVYEVRLDGKLLGTVWYGVGRQKWWWRTDDHKHEGQGWESREAAARELRRRVVELPAYERAYSSKQDKGWYGLVCWNGLSTEQQHMLIDVGTLPFGYKPQGSGCKNGAEVAVETMWDDAPGPRFYCTECAVQHLKIRKAVKTS